MSQERSSGGNDNPMIAVALQQAGVSDGGESANGESGSQLGSIRLVYNPTSAPSLTLAGQPNQNTPARARGGGSAGAFQQFIARESQLFDPVKALSDFWPRHQRQIEDLDAAALRDASRSQELPLARIKKIMKLDEDVKNQMISAEAPVLFAKAAEIFIEELTLRAWIHTEENKRKTLQKSDIAMAVSKNEQFDFLIDIVPREDVQKSAAATTSATVNRPAQQLQTTQRAQAGGDVFQFLNTAPTDHADLTLQGATSDDSNLQYYIQFADGQQMPIAASSLQGLQQVVVSGGGDGSQQQHQSSQSVQLQNGQIVQATPIGPSIPLQSSGGGGGGGQQPLQLISMSGGTGGQPIQLQLISADDDEQGTDVTLQENL